MVCQYGLTYGKNVAETARKDLSVQAVACSAL
jgi:hypothetical protein